jgi:2-polyprenyl-6-hydroxyphenyl methylase/3-demethylubiquinone-9 3-methyltransferase
MHGDAIKRVIRAYDDWIVRGYCWGRFGILRQRFLDEIGQYLPREGRVLDIGCGIGLFSLYYAQVYPKLELRGVDLNPKRVEVATRAAQKLGLTNVSYSLGDARGFRSGETYDAVYMLDVIHHIPPASVSPLVEEVRKSLPRGGRFLVKDVDSKPLYKRLFTHALDLAMDPKTPVHYWSSDALVSLLNQSGFRVYRHAMVDFLPYPHVLYTCERAV